MNTQVIFNIDKSLKEKAMKKARAEGVPFASVLKFATKAFVEGDFSIGMVERPVLNDKTRKILEKALKNIKDKRDLSPRFTSAKDMIAHLNAH